MVLFGPLVLRPVLLLPVAVVYIYTHTHRDLYIYELCIHIIFFLVLLPVLFLPVAVRGRERQRESIER